MLFRFFTDVYEENEVDADEEPTLKPPAKKKQKKMLKDAAKSPT